MNLLIADPSLSRIKVTLLPAPSVFGPELQFKQHPNVGKLAVNKERIIALKDSSRTFPVNQSIAVLKWRYTGMDESYVPLSSKQPHYFPWQSLIAVRKSIAGPRPLMMAPAMSISNTNWRMRTFPFMTLLSPSRFRK